MLASSHFPVIGPGIVFIIVALPVLVMGLPAYFAAREPEPEPCPRCGDPQGEGACESPDCIVTPSGYGITPYEPTERDVAEGYIRLLEQEPTR